MQNSCWNFSVIKTFRCQLFSMFSRWRKMRTYFWRGILVVSANLGAQEEIPVQKKKPPLCEANSSLTEVGRTLKTRLH